MTNLGLQGKRVVVTGAAGGLGKAFATSFADAGAQVLLADVDAQGIALASDQLNDQGYVTFHHPVDIVHAESCQELAAVSSSSLGGVDVLVNNAALYAGLKRSPFEEIDEDLWDKVMSVNVKGVWQTCRAFSGSLRSSDHASIINVASATVFSGSPNWMHYVASKGAVISMSRVMAKEMGDDDVRVNVLAPGFTLTDASLSLIDEPKYGAGRSAFKRNAEITDIVGGALYLASPISKFMTGQTMIIDGGKEFI